MWSGRLFDPILFVDWLPGSRLERKVIARVREVLRLVAAALLAGNDVARHGRLVHAGAAEPAGNTRNARLPARERASESRNGELVLVIDDEAPVPASRSRPMNPLAVAFITAEDGAEARRAIAARQLKFAVVATDMTMPFMDGGATIQVLTRMNPKVRIIAVSGIDTNEEAAKPARRRREALPA